MTGDGDRGRGRVTMPYTLHPTPLLLKGAPMSIEKVKQYFATLGIENRIQEFPVSSATVELAAEALGCEGKRIANGDRGRGRVTNCD